MSPRPFCCPTCGAVSPVTNKIAALLCGHFVAFRTCAGVVMFWEDTGVMTLKLARAAGEAVPGRLAPQLKLTAAATGG